MPCLARVRLPLDDLPVRVLANDLAVRELEQVAAADLDPLAVRARAGQEPLRAAAVAGEPVARVAVVDVRDAGEAAGETLTHALPPFEPAAPRLRPARHLEHALVGEEAHHRVD